MALKALNSQGPVTAARFLGFDWLLAGSGSFIKLYSWRTSELLHAVQLFPIDKVHGITTFANESKAIVWGGRSIAVLSSLENAILHVDSVYTCKDRIIDTAVLENSSLYVLTAHNEVLEFALPSMDLLKSHRCSERSILYSGSLYITAQKRFAAAGTVFGGVVIWNLDSDSITHKFENHEGSIFDVSWSQDGRYVASCSDDRAVNVSSLISGKCEAQGWGHVARIWKVKFIDSHTLISVAEDCSARVWQFNPGTATAADLECTRIMTGHQGRSIWSVDIHVESNVNNDTIIATGGGDGKIMLWEHSNSRGVSRGASCSTSADGSANALESSSRDSSGNVEQWNVNSVFGAQVRSCAVGVHTGSLVVTLVNGRVFFKPKDSQVWKLIDTQLGPVPVVKALESRFYIMSLDGAGIVLSEVQGSVESQFHLEERIQDFFVVDGAKLVVVPTPPSTDLIIVDSLTGNTDFRHTQQPGVGVVTSACSIGPQTICLGSRNGALTVYDQTQKEPIKVVPAALGTKTDAITDLAVVLSNEDSSSNNHNNNNHNHNNSSSPNNGTNNKSALGGGSSSNSSSCLLVTSRSSDYGYFSLPDLARLFKNRARKRGSVEGLHLHKQGAIFWGFQKDTFVVWNASLGFELVGVNCGGMYRAWDCCVLPSGICFIYVRAGDVFVHHIQTPSSKFAQPLLQQGTHGREIRGLEMCPAGDNRNLIATGSEDTVISFGRINANWTNIRNVCSVRDGHVSGIQCLHWDPSGKYVLTGAGKGELVMWEVVTRGDSAVFANEVGRMPSKRTELQELRVMEFSIHKDMVAVAYSDSSYRIWRLRPVVVGDKSNQKFIWELLLQSKYRECCLLNINLLELYGKLWLFITSTDGHLVVYRVVVDSTNGTMIPVCKLRTPLHQSGVRTSVICENEKGVVHYSGGDDNALCAVQVLLNENDDHVDSQILFSVKNAHSSAVTSVQILAYPNEIATTGSDQKVKLWSTSSGHEISTTYTDVSDTGAMVVQDNHLITAGIGVEFFEVVK